MGNRGLSALIVVCVAYIAAQMIADVTSLKIVLVAGLSFDAGTLIYPFTFTLRDLVHKAGGIVAARLVIVSAAAINLLMAAFFALTSALPGDPSVGPQEAFAMVLNPVWRIVIASIVAEVIAELIDSEVYRRWEQRFGERWQWGRVLSSNAVSVPLDSAAFVLLAFAGTMPTETLWAIFAANVLIKGAVTLVSLPWIYAVRVPRVEFVT